MHTSCEFDKTFTNRHIRGIFQLLCTLQASIRAEMTQSYCERRIRHLLDFIKIEVDNVSIENRYNTFVRKANDELKWAVKHVIQFLHFRNAELKIVI